MHYIPRSLKHLIILFLIAYTSVHAQTSFNISNKTTGDTLLSIDNDGKVGIGTTSPGASVDVKSAAVENGSSLNLGNYDDSHWLYLYSGRSGASALSPVMIWNEGDPMRFASWGAQYNEYMRISGNGFLGLGTDNPGVKLDIQLFNNDPWERAIRALNPTMIADDALFLVLGRSDDLKNMGHMNFKYLADASDENRLSFGLWGVNDVLNILGSGNVGIGIINPTQKLEVDGTVHSISGGFMFPDGTVQGTASNSVNLWNQNGSNIYYNSGNVGIGTSTPAYPLTLFPGTNTTGLYIDHNQTGTESTSGIFDKNLFPVWTYSYFIIILTKNQIKKELSIL